MFYVYLYEDPKSLLPRYVGKGVRGRMYVHLNGSHNRRLANMIAKRQREGFDIQPSVVCGDLTDNASKAIERFWIATIGRANTNAGPLFNATDGGDGAAGVVGKTQAAWNKGLKLGPNLKLQGKPLPQDAIAKRTISRRANNGGKYCKPLSDQARENIRKGWDKRRAKMNIAQTNMDLQQGQPAVGA